MLYTPVRDTGSSPYCGPTAIATITGLRGSDVRDAIRQARGDIRNARGGHMPVARMSNTEVLATMALLGWKIVDEGHYPPPPFKQYRFAQFLADRGDGGPFIVNVTGHYIAVAHNEVCDSDACLLPLPVTEYLARKRVRYAGAWVKNWWRFECPELSMESEV